MGKAIQQAAKRQLLSVFCGSLFPRLHVLFSPGVLMLLVKMRNQL